MMLILQQILFLLLVYFISSIPFGLLFGKIFANTDLRKHGSGNIGATNATRVLGKKLGLLTLILDGAKGGLMVIVARFGFSDINNLHLYLTAVAFVAIIGHIYPKLHFWPTCLMFLDSHFCFLSNFCYCLASRNIFNNSYRIWLQCSD